PQLPQHGNIPETERALAGNRLAGNTDCRKITQAAELRSSAATKLNRDSNQRLLRRAGRKEERFGRRDSQGLPQTCAQIPSRCESRRQEVRGEVQRNLRGQRRSQRSQEAQDLR